MFTAEQSATLLLQAYQMVGNSVPVVASSPAQPEDMVAVRSRISWGAITAGAVLALSLYFAMTLLGGAIGLSIGGKASAQTLEVGAAVWAIVTTVLCLFAGGFVASQLTVGENKQEAAAYGLLVWALVFAMLLWLMATGVQAGFNAMMGVATAGTAAANVTANNTTADDWEAAAQKAGVDPKQLEEWKQKAKDAPARAKAAADDLATKEKLEQAQRDTHEAAKKVTWWAFVGTMLSMAAAAGGGYLGAGPTFRLFAVPVRTTPNRIIVS